MGKFKLNLRYQMPESEFVKDFEDTICDILIHMYCPSGDCKYFDYIMKVLYPEALLKIHMIRNGCTKEEAEETLDPMSVSDLPEVLAQQVPPYMLYLEEKH